MLTIKQRLTSIPTSFFDRQLFIQLIMVGKYPNLVGKADTSPFMPLPCDLFTHHNAPKSFYLKIGKVLKDKQLIDLGG
jgi:hypothetical protein